MSFDAEHRIPVHLLHIGKTGGTALKDGLAHFAREKPWLRLHNHAARLMDIPPGHRVIFFLRNPITRFVSGFYSRQRQGRPRYFSPWIPGEAAAFAIFHTANELGETLSIADERRRADAQNAMRAIEHVRDSFWKWLGSPDLLSSRAADILFIGQQESLAADSRVLADGVHAFDLAVGRVDHHRDVRMVT